jgi:hypothetical protein
MVSPDFFFFTDDAGKDYVMLVDLSLERSAQIRLKTSNPDKTKQVYSTVDGRLYPWDEKNGHRTLAGHGLLIRLD